MLGRVHQAALHQAVEPVEVGETSGVEISIREGDVISRVAMGPVDTDGNTAVAAVVDERIDPLPDDFALAGHLEEPATRTFADEH